MLKISQVKEKNITRIEELLDELKSYKETIRQNYKSWDSSPQNDLIFDIRYCLREIELLYRNLTNTRLTRTISEEERLRRSNDMKKNRFTKTR